MEELHLLFPSYLSSALVCLGLKQVASEVDAEQHAEQEDNSIQRIAERVAANIVNLGQHIRDSAAHLLINLGYQIHQML